MSEINLQDWLGKTESLADRVYPTPAKALARTLDDQDFEPGEGQPLPELWYWLYFLPMAAASQIDGDGHPKRGGFLPPVALERRMWAGSRIRFHDDLLIGEAITKDAEIIKIAEKAGKTGSMVFVTVKHQVKSARGVAVTEEQDIVYLAKPTAFNPPPPTALPAAVAWREAYPVDPVLLFRFSALTFNAHKIHYDRRYAADEEKYPGLVVHGPLQALLLLESAKRHHPGQKPASYTFRGMRPMFDFDRISLCGQPKADQSCDLYTANGDDAIGMQATVSWRE